MFLKPYGIMEFCRTPPGLPVVYQNMCGIEYTDDHL